MMIYALLWPANRGGTRRWLARICGATQPDCVAGVVFFNNVGYLHGCLHGTIGVAVTLAHLGRLTLGENKIETPTGIVTVRPLRMVG